MFLAMAAFLVSALCVPEAFGSEALLFAVAYGVVRVAHILLFVLASRDDPGCAERSLGLAVSTAIGVGLLLLAAAADGWLQGGAVGARAGARHGRPAADRPGRLAARARPLRRAPRADRDHRAGRVDRRDRRRGRARTSTPASCVAAVLGIVVAACAVVALLRRRRAGPDAAAGRGAGGPERNAHGARLLLVPALPDGRRDRARRARDEEDARARRRSAATSSPTVALLGGAALYLLAHVAFRLRNVAHAQQTPARARARCCSRSCRRPTRCRRSHRSRSSRPRSTLLISYETGATARRATARAIRHRPTGERPVRFNPTPLSGQFLTSSCTKPCRRDWTRQVGR